MGKLKIPKLEFPDECLLATQMETKNFSEEEIKKFSPKTNEKPDIKHISKENKHAQFNIGKTRNDSTGMEEDEEEDSFVLSDDDEAIQSSNSISSDDNEDRSEYFSRTYQAKKQFLRLVPIHRLLA